MTIVLDADTGISGANAVSGVTSINLGQVSGSRNKIINGAMEINQRGTSAVNTDQAFPSDRFKTAEAGGGNMTCQVVADAPASFRNSIKVIASTADDCTAAADEYRIMHRIEGNNVVDLYYGASGAKTTTLSFYVKSSLTGNFPVGLENAASNRSHVKEYIINSANTWEKKTVTFVGDETGTWLITNGTGLTVSFVLGAGSNYTGTIDSWQGARVYRGSSSVQMMATEDSTWFVTGIQLEVGSTATEFEYRSIADELALCQRYFTKSFPQETAPANNAGVINTIIGESQAASGPAYAHVYFKQTMRAAPSISHFNPSANNGSWRNTTANSDINVAVGSIGDATMFIGSNTQVMNQYAICQIHYSASAEL